MLRLVRPVGFEVKTGRSTTDTQLSAFEAAKPRRAERERVAIELIGYWGIVAGDLEKATG